MTDKIDHSSGVPLYRQLYAIMYGLIKNKKWGPGEMMPPESALIKKYKVSRITVRQVFDLLVKDGLIYRERGRGTYIAEPKLKHGLERITSFTEDMERRGRKPGAEVLGARKVAVSAETAEALGMQAGDDAIMIMRLRTADGKPVCVEQSLLHPERCPDILRFSLKNRSMQKLLQERYDIRWLRAAQKIQALAVPAEKAKHLGIKPKEPVLYIERISYDQQDRPVELLLSWYRADRYTLYNELKG